MGFRIDTIDLFIVSIVFIFFIWRVQNFRKFKQEVLDILDNKNKPLDQVILCPYCFTRHVDCPDQEWTNPPHKTHLCRRADGGCGKTFRPSVFYTNGV